MLASLPAMSAAEPRISQIAPEQAWQELSLQPPSSHRLRPTAQQTLCPSCPPAPPAPSYRPATAELPPSYAPSCHPAAPRLPPNAPTTAQLLPSCEPAAPAPPSYVPPSYRPAAPSYRPYSAQLQPSCPPTAFDYRVAAASSRPVTVRRAAAPRPQIPPSFCPATATAQRPLSATGQLLAHESSRTFADVRGRSGTFADVRGRSRTFADVRGRSRTPSFCAATARRPPGYRPATTQLPLSFCAATARIPPGNRRATAGLPPGYRPAPARLPPGCRPATAQFLCGYRPATARLPPNVPCPTVWLPSHRFRRLAGFRFVVAGFIETTGFVSGKTAAV